MNKQLSRQVPRVLERTLATSFATVEEGLEAFGCNFGVVKHPLFTRIPQGVDPATGKQTGIMKRADNLFGVVRTDTDATLAAVSSRYECVGQVEALAPFEELVRAGGLAIRRGGAIHGGSRVWVTAEMAGIEVAGHKVAFGVTANFRHDGKGITSYWPFVMRETCFNPLQELSKLLRNFEHAWSARMQIRHVSSGLSKVALIGSQLETLEATREALAFKFKELLAATFTRSEMERLTRQLIGERPEELWSTGKLQNAREVHSWDAKFEAIMESAWGADDLHDVRFTKFGALNAIADYEAHLVPVKGTHEQRQERLMVRTLDSGPLMLKAAQLIDS